MRNLPNVKVAFFQFLLFKTSQPPPKHTSFDGSNGPGSATFSTFSCVRWPGRQHQLTHKKGPSHTDPMLLVYIPLGTSKFIFFEYADVPWYTSVILWDWYSDFSKKAWIKNQDLAFKSHSNIQGRNVASITWRMGKKSPLSFTKRNGGVVPIVPINRPSERALIFLVHLEIQYTLKQRNRKLRTYSKLLGLKKMFWYILPEKIGWSPIVSETKLHTISKNVSRNPGSNQKPVHSQHGCLNIFEQASTYQPLPKHTSLDGADGSEFSTFSCRCMALNGLVFRD